MQDPVSLPLTGNPTKREATKQHEHEIEENLSQHKLKISNGQINCADQGQFIH